MIMFIKHQLMSLDLTTDAIDLKIYPFLVMNL